MEEKNIKSKIYYIILIIMLLFAVVLSFTKKTKNETPAVENNDNIIQSVKQNIGFSVLGNKEDLLFFSIPPLSEVNGLVSYNGEIKGGYFFEGNILINILDINKNILKTSYATAKGNWMTKEPVLFEGSIDFLDLPMGRAYIEIQNDNPGAPNEGISKRILIPIIIN